MKMQVTDGNCVPDIEIEMHMTKVLYLNSHKSIIKWLIIQFFKWEKVWTATSHTPTYPSGQEVHKKVHDITDESPGKYKL